MDHPGATAHRLLSPEHSQAGRISARDAVAVACVAILRGSTEIPLIPVDRLAQA